MRWKEKKIKLLSEALICWNISSLLTNLRQKLCMFRRKEHIHWTTLTLTLTPSINLLLLRSPCPEQRSLCSLREGWKKKKETVVPCCKSSEADWVTGFWLYCITATLTKYPPHDLLWSICGFLQSQEQVACQRCCLVPQNSSLWRICTQPRCHTSTDTFHLMTGWWHFMPGAL